MSESPADLPGLDPDEFVGEPPTGEQDPVAFTSGDQSGHETEDPDGSTDGGEENEAP